MERCPAIMLMIEDGMKNGEILRGPPTCRKVSHSDSMVESPPMPAPAITPQRSGSSLPKSMPEFVTAWMPAATP